MKKARIGIIGAGWWATFAHIPAIKSHSDAELAAVQSREADNAAKIACDFGAQKAFTKVEEMVRSGEMDAVIISSTPNVHFAHARAALENGLHLLIEKPMTMTAAEAQTLVQLAERNQLELIVSCPWHFTAHGVEGRRLIRGGALGEIKLISILMTNPVDKLLRGTNTMPTHAASDAYVHPRAGSYSDPAVAGGGQIYCQVSHAAAYLTFLTGLRPAKVYARFDRDGAAVDIYDAMTITMENGSLVTLASTGATPNAERAYEVRIFGSKAVLQMELWKGTMSMADFEDRRTDFPPLAENEIYPSRAPAMNLVDTILGRAGNGSPGQLGQASMEVIEAACISAESDRPIHIRPVKAASAIKVAA